MLNRLLSIIYILMNKGRVTAGELAERFEVSTRTIYRDVETLSMAGIPVYAQKGKKGGISLTEQFVLNKMLVTREEQTQILAALASLQETGAVDEQGTLTKLGEFFHTDPVNWVSIDFSDWGGQRKQLYDQIRDAVLNRRILTFDYYGQTGEMSHRTVEPLQLLFKEYTWYLKAYCRDRQSTRLFKILRMKRTQVTYETFSERTDTEEDRSISDFPAALAERVEPVTVEMIIQKKEAYRVYDRFEEEDIEILPSGDFHVWMHCTPDDWNYGLVLSFGPAATVIEPEDFRKEIYHRISYMKAAYEEEE